MSSASKKVISVRANQQQVAILRGAFAQSPVPQDVQRLMMDTGLTEKWILGWFQRERRKCKLRGVKEEEGDSSLCLENTSRDTRSDSEATDNRLSFPRSSKPPRKKAKTNGARKKEPPAIKAETVEPAIPIQQLTPVSALSASVLSGRSESGSIVGSADQVHIPHSTVPKSSKPSKRRRGKQKCTSATKTKNINASSSVMEAVATNASESTVMSTPAASSGSHSLLPLPQILLGVKSQPIQTTVNEVAGMAHTTAVNSTFATPLLPPLLPSPRLVLNHGASDFRSQVQAPTSSPALFSPSRSSYVQRAAQAPSTKYGQLKREAVSQVLNPYRAPLKHLTVLRKKLSNGSSSMSSEDECKGVMGVLLEERLAREDPFQAAMGLVFLGRLETAVREA